MANKLRSTTKGDEDSALLHKIDSNRSYQERVLTKSMRGLLKGKPIHRTYS